MITIIITIIAIIVIIKIIIIVNMTQPNNSWDDEFFIGYIQV